MTLEMFWPVAAVFLAGFLLWSERRRRVALGLRLAAEWGAVRDGRPLDLLDAEEGWRALRRADDAATEIDAQTWEDLGLDEVLGALDRTRTVLGRQMCYRRLRSGEAWSADPALERIAARLAEDAAAREAVGRRLAGTRSTLGRNLWPATHAEFITLRWWYALFPLLALAMVGALLGIAWVPRLLVVAVALSVANMAMRALVGAQAPMVLAPIRQLGTLFALADRLAGALGDAADDGLRRDLATIARLRRIVRFAGPDPDTMGELGRVLMEYLNLVLMLDLNVLLFAGRAIRRDAATIGRLARRVGDIDLAYAVASLRAEPGRWCRPVADDGPLRLTGIRHPLVHGAVANDLVVDAGQGLVITGANMSGKSTYLRSVGVAVALARAFDLCPAEACRGPRLAVRSQLARQDDLAAGTSYYQAEVDGVVGLLRRAGTDPPTLFLLDEPLRGTNRVERVAAATAVLRHLAVGAHRVLAATHDGELVPLLAPRFAPFHFRETLTPAGLRFEYHRHAGPATTRTALALLEASGAPAAVVTEARAVAEGLEG